jgi:hypothetical protein
MLDRLPTFKPRQFGNAVFAIGKLNLYNAELVDALLAVRRGVGRCRLITRVSSVSPAALAAAA